MISTGVVWPAKGEVSVGDVEIGEPAAREVLIETEVSLVSPGTERQWLTGINPISPHLNATGSADGFPFRPGYALAGRVAAVGAEVDNVRVGDRVVAPAPHGAHATVRADRVHRVPDEVDLRDAVFFALGAVAMNGARRARIELGEAVAVFGLGLVGLLSVRMARLQGGLPVVGVDLIASRLDFARTYGADLVADASAPEELSRLAAELPGGGPSVVIEATAAQEPIDLALRIVRPLGRVILLSSRVGKVTVDLDRGVHRKGTNVIGVHALTRPLHESREGNWTIGDETRAFLGLLAQGRLNVAPLVTHAVPGSDAPKLYELVKNGDPGLIGGLLEWS
jgi:L-iditol 2-dehydrogenase